MLFRLNHELLPEPGSPMASTTVPLLGRCEAIAVGAGVDAAIASAGAVCGSAVGDFGAAEATDVGRLRPRPPRPRRRRGRPTALAACDPVPVWAGVADSEAESKSASLLCLKSGASEISAVGSVARGSAESSDPASGSKYAGCSGAGRAPASSWLFLRPLSLSRIHLRMLGL